MRQMNESRSLDFILLIFCRVGDFIFFPIPRFTQVKEHWVKYGYEASDARLPPDPCSEGANSAAILTHAASLAISTEQDGLRSLLTALPGPVNPYAKCVRDALADIDKVSKRAAVVVQAPQID